MIRHILSAVIAIIVIAAFGGLAYAGAAHTTPAMSPAKASSPQMEKSQSVSATQDSTGAAVTKESTPPKKAAAVKQHSNPKKMSSKMAKHSKKEMLKAKKAAKTEKKTEETAKSPDNK